MAESKQMSNVHAREVTIAKVALNADALKMDILQKPTKVLLYIRTIDEQQTLK